MNVNRLLAAVLSLFIVACPSGESRSIDDVLTDSREAYLTAAGKLTPELQERLAPVIQATEKIAAGQAAKEDAGVLSDRLLDLLNHAGYTQRPSFTELAYALREARLEEPQTKLLASRMYRLLAAEMSSTRFGL